MLVGIVVRTKNRNSLLLRALSGIAKQSYANWFLVIVNDGGDADSLDSAVASWRSQYSDRIQPDQYTVVHNRQSLGVSGAANTGLAALPKTDFIALHDDDDFWPQTFLAESVAEFLKQKQLGKIKQLSMVVSPVDWIEEEIRICESDRPVHRIIKEQRKSFPGQLAEGWVSLYDLIQANRFPPIAVLMNAHVVSEVGVFRTDLPVLDDWEFFIRLLMKGEAYVRGGTPAQYRVRPKSTSHEGNSITVSRTLHLSTRRLLENEWLRQDLESGKMGLGTLIAQHQDFQAGNPIETAILRELRQGGLLRDGKAFARAIRRGIRFLRGK